MSSQPSTLDQVKDKASNTYDTVSHTLSSTEQAANPNDHYDETKDPANFTRDVYGNTVKKGGFKDQLNEAAVGGGKGEKEEEEGVVEKVLSYIPGAKQLQKQFYGREEESEKETEGPPKRPEHDVQVEEFLREQYQSRSGDGMPDPDSVRK